MSENPNQNHPYNPEESPDYSISGGFNEFGDDIYAQQVNEGLNSDFEAAFGHKRHAYARAEPHRPTSPSRHQELARVREDLEAFEGTPKDRLKTAYSSVATHVTPEQNRFAIVNHDTSGGGATDPADTTSALNINGPHAVVSISESPAEPRAQAEAAVSETREVDEGGRSAEKPEEAPAEQPKPEENPWRDVPENYVPTQTPEAESTASGQDTPATAELSTPSSEAVARAEERRSRFASYGSHNAQRAGIVSAEEPEQTPAISNERRESLVDSWLDTEGPEVLSAPPAPVDSATQRAAAIAAYRRGARAAAKLSRQEAEGSAPEAEPVAPEAATSEARANQSTADDEDPYPWEPRAAAPAPETAPTTSESGFRKRSVLPVANSLAAQNLDSDVIGLARPEKYEDVGNLISFASVAATRKGRHALNQDAFSISAEHQNASIADGMGSKDNSELGAQAAVDVWETAWDYAPDEDLTPNVVTDVMRTFAANARRAVADTDTTAAFIGVKAFSHEDRNKLVLFAAGDCKGLVIDAKTGEIIYASTEQAGFFVGENGVTPVGGSEAPENYAAIRNANVLNNGLGASKAKTEDRDAWPRVDDELKIIDLPDSALVVLASDGLWGDKVEDRLDPETVRDIVLQSSAGSGDAVTQLIRASLKVEDDVSVSISRIDRLPAKAEWGPDNGDDEEDKEGNTAPAAPNTTSDFSDWYVDPSDDESESSIGVAASTAGEPEPGSATPSTASTDPYAPVVPSIFSPEGDDPFSYLYGGSDNTAGTPSPAAPTPAPIPAAPTPATTPTPRTRAGRGPEATGGASAPAPDAFGDIFGGEPARRRHARPGIISRRIAAARGLFSRDANAAPAPTPGTTTPLLPEQGFFTRTKQKFGEFWRGDDLDDTDPASKDKLVVRQGIVGFAAVALAATVIGGAYNLIDSDESTSKKQPSVSAPRVSESPDASPSASNDKKDKKPSPSVSPDASPTQAPERDRGEADAAGGGSGGAGNVDRDTGGNPEAELPPRTPEAPKPRVEGSYMVTNQPDGSVVIELRGSHGEASIWGGVKKGLQEEDIAATDALVYDLTGRALEMKGKSWQDASTIHEGSKVTIGKDANGRPIIKNLELR